MAEKNSNFLIKFFKALAILFTVAITLYGIVILLFLHNTHYVWFTDNRRAKMQDIYSIQLTDNIKLCDYKEDGMLANMTFSLRLRTYNLEKFMTENIKGTITEKYENGNFSYKGRYNEEVFADIEKRDSKDYYSITLHTRN
ncbi:MAG: hypothetical protein K2J40_03605 [Ruminococcus sp.]|nr:hypothetical protein [Ruminococcus sp.]